MYKLSTTTKYRRDSRRCQKRRLNMELLFQALDLLEQHGELPEGYNTHSLHGEYKGCLDAHLAPDWVLIFQVSEDQKIIKLIRTGSHQDIFKGY